MRVASLLPFVATLFAVAAQSLLLADESRPASPCDAESADGGNTWTEWFDGYYSRR